MPDLIVDLSEAYLKSKVESAFMNAASCKNVYDRSINALGSTWYIDKVQVNAVGLSSGAAATAVMQPGLPATAATELLANLKVTVTFAKLDVLKAGGTSRLPMPITLTLRLDATAGSGDLLFSAAFHSVSPAKVGDFDVEKLLKSAIPTFSEPMGLASLAGASVTVRGAAMGRLASGAVRIGVGITDATSLDQVSKLILVARWTTLWSTGGPSSPLKASDHWALLFTAGAMNALAQAQFPVVAAKLKANGINVSGAPSVKWDGASASLTVKAEGEYEVPVCPDINLWFKAKTSFAMTKPPLLVSTVCTDGGLTATGWLEAIGCGLAGLGVAGLIAGPLGDLGAIIGTIFAGVYASDKIDKNTGCTTTAAALATKDFTATRLQSGSNGLTVAGTASLAAFGKTAVTVSSNLSSGQWVNPRCAGSYKYAPISLKNTGTEPVTLCRCESHPPFEVVVGGYTYQSGAPIGEEIAPGGVLEIKALGSGMILVPHNRRHRSHGHRSESGHQDPGHDRLRRENGKDGLRGFLGGAAAVDVFQPQVPDEDGQAAAHEDPDPAGPAHRTA